MMKERERERDNQVNERKGEKSVILFASVRCNVPKRHALQPNPAKART